MFKLSKSKRGERLEERDGRVIRVPFADMRVIGRMIKVIIVVDEEMLIVK